ncbi:hypothetical protein BELL_0808g00030 [Botrytis elliptica]|uniref:Uncharacterized protein n=1 Tax=Botrytis elliptica TaxID=278938 RepID=A0A4Z1JBB3_9HELO|nr:hypothetical protein BELL_0808g00030 [Botrytis elliptica]
MKEEQHLDCVSREDIGYARDLHKFADLRVNLHVPTAAHKLQHDFQPLTTSWIIISLIAMVEPYKLSISDQNQHRIAESPKLGQETEVREVVEDL